MDIPPKSIDSENKLSKLFFQDKLKEAVINSKELRKYEVKERPLPFFELESKQSLGFDLEKKLSNKIHLVLPEEAIDTKDPTINSKDFMLKNLRISLENEIMVLLLIRRLAKIEDYLLFLLTEKKLTLTDEDLDTFINTLKESLPVLRDPTNQDLYNKLDIFYTEFETTLNYLRENREWPKK